MDKKDFYFLGKVTKTSGYKGSLVFFFDVDNIDDYKDLEAVFIEIGGELIPFAIESLTVKSGSSAYVKLEEIDGLDEAASIAGCELYLPLSYLPPLSGNDFYFHEVKGFLVVDKNHGNIGNIVEIYTQASQAIFSIYNEDGKEILVPATDEIITNVDRDKKTITVETPAGLIDIYL
ncbi:MAG: ribosome maturation factor RimM [Bacteroidales bacterium]